MAIYHCQLKPVSRGQGRSSTAAAAYRSCSKVFDARTGELHDYSRKRGLEHAEIVLSKEATQKDIQWARDRERLWNAAEATEKRKDARVGREYEVALPYELGKQQRIELVHAFSQDLANRYQCGVDFAIHKPHRAGDERNFHAHILTTTRQVTPTGLGEKTYIEKSDTDRAKLGLGPGKDEVRTLRERWAEHVNRALEEAKQPERVDHRSLEAQGIDRMPTRHKGPAIAGLEARGERSHVLERVKTEEASARLAKAAEVGRVEREAQEVRQGVIQLSTDVGAAKAARETSVTRPSAGAIERAKQQALEAAKRYKQERDKALEAARGLSKDREKSLVRGKDDGLELVKTPPKGPKGPGDGHGR